MQPAVPLSSSALPIPGHPGYTVTPEGTVFLNGLPKELRKAKGRATKLRLRTNGIPRELGLAKLVATLFIPNPQQYTRVVFTDGDTHNCAAANIRWVSNSGYARSSMLKNRVVRERKGRTPKPKAPALERPAMQRCTDPSAVPLPGYEGYYITPCAKVYRGNSVLKPHNSGKKSLQLRISNNGAVKSLGLAKLIATAFLPNPQGHTRIIFKDRNNKNCTLANIAWAGAAEYNAYTGSFRRDRPQQPAEPPAGALPIPGFEGYAVTPAGTVYKEGRLLKPTDNGGRSARVKLRNSAGKLTRIAVAKLVALTFVPNPEAHPKIIFIDRNKANCTAANIRWVSLSQFASFVHTSAGADSLLGPPKQRKTPEPVWIDPERVELTGVPGYYISPAGTVYKGDKVIRPQGNNGGSLKIRIHPKGWPRGRYLYFGLGKLLAEHFIPNPRHHRHIIFKDRNNRNCTAANIAWVDGETFAFYSGISRGAKKRQGNRLEAARTCTDVFLREYYKTLDEYWLHECWKEMEKRMISKQDWDAVRADCYLYFLDRAKRFTLLKDPLGLVLLYSKGVRARLRREISSDIPASLVRKTDESLRHTGLSRADMYY